MAKVCAITPNIFLVLSVKLALWYHAGAYNLEVAPTCLENFCTRDRRSEAFVFDYILYPLPKIPVFKCI